MLIAAFLSLLYTPEPRTILLTGKESADGWQSCLCTSLAWTCQLVCLATCHHTSNDFHFENHLWLRLFPIDRLALLFCQRCLIYCSIWSLLKPVQDLELPLERIITVLLMGKSPLPLYRKYCFKMNLSFQNIFLSLLLKRILFIDVKTSLWISFHFYKKQKGFSVQQFLKEVTLFSLISLGEVDSIIAGFHLIPFLYAEDVSWTPRTVKSAFPKFTNQTTLEEVTQ